MPQDGIYSAIKLVLVLTVMAGAVLTVTAESYFKNPDLGYVGTGATVIAGALYFFFRYLGRREAKKRSSPKGD
ncbi:MAG: hypothetical protein AAF530_00655 [Pseudomonadota bacterium]